MDIDTKGERKLAVAAKPNALGLPGQLRAAETITFDTTLYRLREEAAALLSWSGPRVGFGRFVDHANEDARVSEQRTASASGTGEQEERPPAAGGIGRGDDGSPRAEFPFELEQFTADEKVFTSFKYEKHWRQCVLEAKEFLAAYERLIKEVVCPRLKARLGSECTDPTTFYYQYPPTLRLQPGPCEHFRRVHRDAEYGHQEGEINIWMPLTHYSMTKTTLWIESEPFADDFYAVELDYGSMLLFHGTLCRHSVPANVSPYIRVSMDFRVGVSAFYDPAWKLNGIAHSHGRRQHVL